MKSYYQILGVKTDASPEQIKDSFGKKVENLSKNLNKKKIVKLKELHEAYINLVDPLSRHQYDYKSGLIKSESVEAPWRRHYAHYTKELRKRDLKLADHKIEVAINRQPEHLSPIVMIFLNFLALSCLLLGGLFIRQYLRGGDLSNLAEVFSPLDFPIPYLEEVKEKDNVLPVLDTTVQKEFEIPEHELELIRELTEEDRLIVTTILDDLSKFLQKENYSKIRENCQIYFEDVSIASEMKIKYTAIHDCFILNQNQ